MDEPRPPTAGVSKDRRKILLADNSSSIIAYLIRKEPINMALNSTVMLSHFRIANGNLTIHDKMLVTR